MFIKTLNIVSDKQLPCLTPLQTVNCADNAPFHLTAYRSLLYQLYKTSTMITGTPASKSDLYNSVKSLANIKRRDINGAAPVCKILNSRFQRKYRIHRANLFFEAKL